MLAQSFKSAADLGLTTDEQGALIKVLGMLEREEIAYRERGGRMLHPWERTQPVGFNMYHFFGESDCGTIACIAGWAIHIGKLDRGLIDKRFVLPALADLFDPYDSIGAGRTHTITPAQAATALRSYLTTGSANWAEAIT